MHASLIWSIHKMPPPLLKQSQRQAKNDLEWKGKIRSGLPIFGFISLLQVGRLLDQMHHSHGVEWYLSDLLLQKVWISMSILMLAYEADF